MRIIDKIIIHCTATPEGRNVTLPDVDMWHKSRGFKSIGYHYLIYIDGSIHEGRPLTEPGAHCAGHNANSIGVCYVGGMAQGLTVAKDTRTAEQKDALKYLIQKLRKMFPGATVHGHNEFANKACPCFDVKAEFSLN